MRKNNEVNEMNLADKISVLRKRKGWSQEELAEQLHVTRQSVSKWESAQSVPDLEKVLQLSQIFDVSTDYLLKDNFEEQNEPLQADEAAPIRRVSMTEAEEFLRIKAFTAKRIAAATLLCILSPICLMLLGAYSSVQPALLTEEYAAGIGLIVMILMVAAATAVFLSCSAKTSPFEYLEKETIETEARTADMVKQRREQYRPTYAQYNTLGACICILSAIPLFAGILVPESDVFMVWMLCATILLAGVGVCFFIVAGIRWESMQKLLQEGDYTKEKKQRSSSARTIGTIYWLIVTAGYLAYSLYTENWYHSWVVWPVAGVLYSALIIACNAWDKRK